MDDPLSDKFDRERTFIHNVIEFGLDAVRYGESEFDPNDHRVHHEPYILINHEKVPLNICRCGKLLLHRHRLCYSCRDKQKELNT